MALEVKAKADEFLFGDWYGELADFPLSFSLHRGNAAMKIEATAGTGIKAEIDSAGTDLYRAKIELLNLAQISNKLIPETSRASFPQTGKVSLELAMNFEQGIAAAGKAKLIGVSLTDKETQVNLDGAVPFEWISADSKDKFLPKSDRNGELKVSAKVGKEIELKETTVKLVAGDNRLGSDSLIDLQFFGGVLSLKSPNVDCSGGECRVSADLDLQQLDLARLGAEMKLPVGFEGKADANLGRVQWSAGSVTTSGTARIAAFNGEITASNILVQNPSNSFRTISGDVALQGIDLKRVSGAFGFGEMEGILDGSIRGLELFGSTPAAFEAEFATRDKGARSISATAINNLAVVSQGQGLSALSSGVYSLFTWYHYRKFGLKCRLKNDVFELYGTARAGSDNYIIDGGWLPPKVDLVTMNPRISFTEMVSRIARVSSQDPEFN